jgi:hypothetical protein
MIARPRIRECREARPGAESGTLVRGAQLP